MEDEERIAREVARKWGAKGGRPRTVVHDAEKKRCRCIDCRRLRGESPPRGGGKVEEGVKPAEGESGGSVRVLVEDPEQW
jgi:hypothetical protein